MNPNNPNQPNTAGIKIGLPNSSNKGFGIKAGIIESNPNAPYNVNNPNNNLKLYDSKDTYNRIPSVNAIVCYINCDDLISNHTNNNTKQSTIYSNPIPNNIESKNIKKSKNFNEIVFDRKHQLNFWEWFVYGGIIVFIGMCLMYFGFIQTNHFLSFLFILFGTLCLNWSYTMLFYKNQDRFYVTNNGIGFEYRHWFRMQKRFFEFGEVNIFFGYIGSTDGGSGDIFIIYPFNKLRIKRLFFLPKDYIKITIYPSASMQDILHLITFIRKRTKEALEAKGIHITDSELKEKIKGYIKNKDI